MNRGFTVLLVGAALTGTLVGCRTSTDAPTREQVAHAREWLSIQSDLSIASLGYATKPGMDYMVRFAFIADTNEPIAVFDPSAIDAREFTSGFVFGPGEPHMTEPWWDHASRDLTGARFWDPVDDSWYLQHIGFYENADATLTVYVWRHETGTAPGDWDAWVESADASRED